jgi:Mg-chelatase subunit ChlD
MVRDVEANAPWQRLRRNLLLVLQLLFLTALILSLARPFTWAGGPAGQALILVVDTSASMAATDGAAGTTAVPARGATRLEAARTLALQLVEDLPDNARVTVIAAGQGAEVRVASSLDRREIEAAIQGLQAGLGGSDLSTALELASAIAARQSEAEIVILSDGRVALPDGRAAADAAGAGPAVQGRVRYLPVGSSGDNQALGVLSLQEMPGGENLSVFVQVVNYGREAARRLALYADGQLVHAYDLEIPAGGERAVVAEGLPAGTQVVEAQLVGQDVLPLDDRAWAVQRVARPAAVTLVGDGNLFLETALALLPGLEVTAMELEDWEAGQAETDPAASRAADLTIFDGTLPLTATLPAGNLLFIAPPSTTAYFTVTGTVEGPVPQAVREDDPLLAHVDLGRGGVSILEAVRLVPLPWARTVIAATGGRAGGESVPLLFTAEVAGRRVAVLAFDLHRSDLPLQVAFPLLLSNLVGWLAPGSGGNLPLQVAPHAPVALSLPPEADAATVTRPDGSRVRVVPQAGQATFADTGQLGVYQVTWQTPATAGEDTARRASFAVNLLASAESDVLPAETLPLAGVESAGEEEPQRQARREWWRPLAWLALALLLAEWLAYNRGAVVRVKDLLERWRAGGGKAQSPRLPLVAPISFLRPGLLWLLLAGALAVAIGLLGRRPAARDRRFWAAMAVRCLLLTLLVFSLAGAQLRHRADSLTAVFVLDASDSVSPEEQAQGESIIRQAIQDMPGRDRAAVVVFGRDALVERLASGERALADLTSVPLTTRTNLAGALQLGMALFPDEGAKRLVLLSDGRQNLGDALTQAELAAARGIELSFVPLGRPESDVEVRLEALDAPADVRLGQSFDLAVTVDSTAPTGAVLRVLADGRLVHSREVRLQPGTNRYLVPVEAEDQGPAGFRRYRAQILPEADAWLQNNEASAFTIVHGPPAVLLVEGQPGEGDNLAGALRAGGMQVTAATPGEIPTTLAGLAGYDAVVLANVPAPALPSGAMPALQAYVRDLGRGLVVTGGENGFGAGGYLRTALEEALPVDMEVRNREQEPNLALVLAVDKSGSMGRCHCDNPDLNQSYVRQDVGQPKVDIAKEAIMRAASALGRLDTLGVVAFDEQAHWALEMGQLPDPVALEQSVGGIQASGQTNLRGGVEVAYQALQGSNARLKHVILMTDGWVHTGDLTALAEEMAEQGITLSVVAAGEGSAEYLAELAERGGGRYYPATDILRVPDFFLKETVQAVGQYIIEEPFFPLPSLPGPVLQGLDPAGLPLLLGYNGTTPKGTARVLLSTPRGDPLLATWQYGLGRAVAWTSDLKGQWATEWLDWPDFARFAAQLVGWTLPVPQVEGVAASVSLREDQALVTVEASDEDGLPRNFLDVSATLIGPNSVGTGPDDPGTGPDEAAGQLPLRQVGPGRYELQAGVPVPGTYFIRLEVREGEEVLGQQILGLAVPYSPEYRAAGADLSLLDRLAALTGGGVLAEPAGAFAHDLAAADRAQDIWRGLLLVAALLFPLDVAIRRVMLGRQDLLQARAWLAARLPTIRRGEARAERTMGQLLQARQRARERQVRSRPAPRPAGEKGDAPNGEPPATTPLTPGEGPPPTGDETLARLREAKKRARRGR